MSDKRPATDGDRLPWLGPLPDRNTAPGPRAAVRGLTILVVLLTLALAGTLSVLLLRGRDAPTLAAPARPAPVARADLPPAPVARPPIVPAPRPPALVAEAPVPTVKPQAPARQVRAKSARSVNTARIDKRRATPRRASRPQVRVHRGVRNWPAAGRGRVIQLGAFNSAGQAVIAWRSTVRDYPYLGTLPRKISIIRVGPRRTRYYRLQVAAPSPRHAEPICRVVRANRRACIVR